MSFVCWGLQIPSLPFLSTTWPVLCFPKPDISPNHIFMMLIAWIQLPHQYYSQIPSGHIRQPHKYLFYKFPIFSSFPQLYSTPFSSLASLNMAETTRCYDKSAPELLQGSPDRSQRRLISQREISIGVRDIIIM